MSETNDEAPARTAAELLRVARDEAAYLWQRVAAARELADLDGHQTDGVSLLTAFAHARGDIGDRWRRWLTRRLNRTLRPGTGTIDWLRATESKALVDLPAQHEAGVATLIEIAGDPGTTASVREFAASRLAEIEGQSESAAASLLRLASDRKVSILHRATAARELAKIPGHETSAQPPVTAPHSSHPMITIRRRGLTSVCPVGDAGRGHFAGVVFSTRRHPRDARASRPRGGERWNLVVRVIVRALLRNSPSMRTSSPPLRATPVPACAPCSSLLTVTGLSHVHAPIHPRAHLVMPIA